MTSIAYYRPRKSVRAALVKGCAVALALGLTATKAACQSLAPETETHSFAPSDVTPEPLALKKNDLLVAPFLSTGYDDNIFRVNTETQKAKAIYLVSPGLNTEFNRILGRNQVSVSVNAIYDIFTNDSSRSRPYIAVKGLATLTPGGSCSATPYADYRRERSDYGDINATIDNNQEIARLGVIVTCKREAGLFPSVSYEHFTTRDTRAFDYADQSTNAYIAGVGYRKPSFGQILLYYRRDNVDRPALGIHNNSDHGGVTFRREISSILSADIDLNYISVNSTDKLIPNYRGLGWHVELTTRALPLTKIVASTSRSIVNDSLLSGGYIVQSLYGLTLDRQISDLTTFSVMIDYLERKVEQDPALARAGLNNDRYLVAGAQIRRKLSDRVTLALEGNHYLRRTNTHISDFDANRVTLDCRLAL